VLELEAVHEDASGAVLQEREARQEAQRRLEAAQEAAIRHKRDIALAVAAERERCARACEDEARLWEADGGAPATEARLAAARIRALA
jgi:hypothetical protein